MSTATNTYDEALTLTNIDSSSIYQAIISALEKGVSEPLYPGDERRIYGEAIVALFVSLLNTMNDVGKQSLLRHARGQVLDAIGDRLQVKRLDGAPAKTVLRFSLTTPRDTNIIIQKWTKVTGDSVNYFATDEIAVLQAGAYSVDVAASSVGDGEKFNGYAADTLTTLVDLIPYIENVTNLYATSGGDDGETYTTDGDDRYRERIRLAPAKLTTAGPELAYIYWALTADSSIVDVKAFSDTEHIAEPMTVYGGRIFIAGPLKESTLVVRASEGTDAAELDTDYTYEYTDKLLTITLTGALANADNVYIEIDKTREGEVKIVPLLEGGKIPGEDILKKVLDVCNAKKVRPMTDYVMAVAPKVVPYDIELVYYTTPSTESEVVTNVEGVSGAIERYNEWQTAALGRDINPDKLRSLIYTPNWADNLTGATRIDLVSPTYTEIADTEVAQFSGRLKVSHKVVMEVI